MKKPYAQEATKRNCHPPNKALLTWEKEPPRTAKGQKVQPHAIALQSSPTHTQRQGKPLWSLELESFLLPWLKVLSKDRLPGSLSSKISLGAKVSPSSLLIWPG